MSNANRSTDHEQHRILSTAVQHSVDLLTETVTPVLEETRPADSVYDHEDFIEVLLMMGSQQVAPTTAARLNTARQFTDADRAESADSAPAEVSSPGGDTVLDALRNIPVEDVLDMVSDSAERTVAQLQNMNALDLPIHISFDITHIPYYGNPEDVDWVQGAPNAKTYTWCLPVATASIIGDDQTVIAGLRPLRTSSGSNQDRSVNRDSPRMKDVVQDLLDHITTQLDLRIDRVVADRAFATADVLQELEQRDHQYVISSPLKSRIKRALDHEMGDANADITIVQDYRLFGPGAGDTNGGEPVLTNLIGAYPENDSKRMTSPQESTENVVPFVTNADVNDALQLDQDHTRALIEWYFSTSQPGVLRLLRDLRPRTQSKRISTRMFVIGFAAVLSNAYTLTNAVVEKAVGDAHHGRARISQKEFTFYLERHNLQ